MTQTTIYTIGHSTHPIEEFIKILQAYSIKLVVDVRTIPRSRHNPQFNSNMLSKSLHSHHILYEHCKDLGGLRHTNKDSINTGWRNTSFRGYADYMQTEEFKTALAKLIEQAKQCTTVIMCAEAVPWRCHRSLIGDALLVHGIKVIDIFGLNSSKPHILTSFAVITDKNITYPSFTGSDLI